MAVVLILLLVLTALGATLLTRSRGTRRKTEKVAENLQRELALDAALVHGFHALRKMDLPVSNPLENLPAKGTEGVLAEVPYGYTLRAFPQKGTVRIEGWAGAKRQLKAYAIAGLKQDVQEFAVQRRWSIRYYDWPEDEG